MSDETSTESDQDLPGSQIVKAATRTHEAIAALAGAKAALDNARTDRNCSAEDISRAATSYRAIEAEVQRRIEAEVEAHISFMDAPTVPLTFLVPVARKENDSDA